MNDRLRRFVSRLMLIEIVVGVWMLVLFAVLTNISPTISRAAAPEAAATANVTIQDFSFNPKVVTAPMGTQVIWTNTGLVTHTVTITGVVDSGLIGPGGMFTRTFSAPGAFPYQCTIHPFLMQATVAITAARSVYLPIIVR